MRVYFLKCGHRGSIPRQNFQNLDAILNGKKKISISPRAILPFTRVRARTYGAIFSKNRFFGTTHGDKPTSQNGISLRSPSLIMAPVPDQCLLDCGCLTSFENMFCAPVRSRVDATGGIYCFLIYFIFFFTLTVNQNRAILSIFFINSLF